MKRWYVVQVYAGYEEVAKADLLKRIQEEGLGDEFGEVLIPSAKLKQSMASATDVKDQQLFPGYVLVEMEKNPATIRAVTKSARILRFLGGIDPVPLSQKEINQIKQKEQKEIAIGIDKDRFVVGSEVDVIEGPFAGFVGIVEKIDHDHDRLIIMVNILGRMMPVELGFNQVR